MSSAVWAAGFSGYSATQSALNRFIAKFAKELLKDGIKVNAANPGYTATDLNGFNGHRSTEEAASIAVTLVTLGDLGPTGGFFHDGHADLPPRHPW